MQRHAIVVPPDATRTPHQQLQIHYKREGRKAREIKYKEEKSNGERRLQSKSKETNTPKNIPESGSKLPGARGKMDTQRGEGERYNIYIPREKKKRWKDTSKQSSTTERTRYVTRANRKQGRRRQDSVQQLTWVLNAAGNVSLPHALSPPGAAGSEKGKCTTNGEREARSRKLNRTKKQKTKN